MSTIAKLDPTVRRARKMRRELLRHMEAQLRMVRSFPVSVRGEIEAFCTEAIDVLVPVLDSPWRTGETKNQICMRIASEFRLMIAEQQARNEVPKASAALEAR